MKKACIKCGKNLRKGQTKYCSNKCAGNLYMGEIEKTCPICGKNFETGVSKARNRTYCSIECQHIGHEKKTAVCFVCGIKLKPGEGYTPSKKHRTRPCDACKALGKWRRVNRGKTKKIKIQGDKWEKRENRLDIFLNWLNKTNGKCAECGKDITSRKFCNEHCKYMNNMLDCKKHLSMVIRSAVRQSIKGEKNRRNTFVLLGYSIDCLKRHLEKQFDSNMNWDNYGSYWHVDHIIPLRAFNYRSPEDTDFRRAWALSNLRPLSAKENLSKRDRLDRPFQPCLAAA